MHKIFLLQHLVSYEIVLHVFKVIRIYHIKQFQSSLFTRCHFGHLDFHLCPSRQVSPTKGCGGTVDAVRVAVVPS